ncbi:MAG: glycoside hydrolase family 20 zincin-like fold domain-containing protein [Bacteroidales bacterium]|nr:glycoside hydrolase family 20 zincin-like fold domain-containing protein [Bacteroidales bacterium]
MIALWFTTTKLSAQPCVVPSVMEYDELNVPETFHFDSTTSVVCYDKTLNTTTKQLREILHHLTGFNLPTTQNKKGTNIILVVDREIPLNDHGYWINIVPNRILISGATTEAVQYGVTTFLQLFVNGWTEDKYCNLPVMSINDEPTTINRVISVSNPQLQAWAWLFKFSEINIDEQHTDVIRQIDKLMLQAEKMWCTEGTAYPCNVDTTRLNTLVEAIRKIL